MSLLLAHCEQVLVYILPWLCVTDSISLQCLCCHFFFVSLAMSVCKVGLLSFVMFVVMHTVNMCTGVVVIVEDNRNTSLFLSLLCL